MITAFINGKVFVGDGKVLEHATVIVEGDRIVKLGKGKTPVPREANKISLEEGTLFPGLSIAMCTCAWTEARIPSRRFLKIRCR
jgi:imidazolonepropionase-like amidohydrolase